MALKLMYITNNLEVALIAQKYGVDRIWVDLEVLDKGARQMGHNAVLSNHKVSDIAVIKPHLTTSEMLVRINHWSDDSPAEVDAVIDAGADIIMLPYWKTVSEVKSFIDSVNGRAKTVLLLETKEAVECVDEVLELQGIDEIHIGLNDLHISYDLDFMFEPLANGMVEMLCRKFAAKGIPYGFGGIAKIGDGAVLAEKIVLEHYRLGSTRAILSRTFCDNVRFESMDELDRVFSLNMDILRKFEQYAEGVSDEVYEKNRQEIVADIERVAKTMRAKKLGG